MNQKVHIKTIDRYRDGGTIAIHTNLGLYCIDSGLGTKTKGMLFAGYPSKSQPLPENEAKELKKQFKIALKEFGMQSLKYQEYLPLIESIRTRR